MSTLKQLAHKHTVSTTRTITKGDDELTADTKAYLAELLAQHLAKKHVQVAVDGESVNYTLQVVVLTHDELEALVNGLNQDKPQQGDMYVGHDTQAG